jgi:uncharacterized protein (DUF885 family)
VNSHPAQLVASVAEEVWQYRLTSSPYLQLRAGVPVTSIRGIGIEDVEHDAAFASKVLDRLAGINEAQLSHDDALTVAFLRHGSHLALEAPQHHWHLFAATPYATYHMSRLPQQVFARFTFDTLEDVELYLSLVRDFGGLARETGGRTAEQARMGIRIPKPALPLVRKSLTGLSAAATATLTPDAERLAGLGAQGAGALERIRAAVESEVRQPFRDAVQLLDDAYEAAAPRDVGLQQYRGGHEAYAYLVRARNTVDRAPTEIHQVGLAEVADLADRMAEVRAELGFTGTEDEFHAQLAHEPSLYAKTPDEVEARYTACMARLEPHLPSLFRRLPKAPYGVLRLPEELEAGLTYGFYEPPTPNEPIGRYRFNASALDQRSLITVDAIAFHELAPGHHFHLARQAENCDLPPIRREAIDLGAFNEGWAEYAAGLALEVGVYASPLQRYGRLAHERFTAQRLVVDTGMNVLGWTLEQGRAYMQANTLESATQVATEVIRYSVDLPAQALGYRLGYLALTAGRRRTEEALGADFDVRDFHETVLGPGALPLGVLDEHIGWAIARAQRQEAFAASSGRSPADLGPKTAEAQR